MTTIGSLKTSSEGQHIIFLSTGLDATVLKAAAPEAPFEYKNKVFRRSSVLQREGTP